VSIPNHKDLVAAARTAYASYTGRERAYLILNAVAWQLRDDGAGLFYKTGDNSYANRSSDVLIFQPREDGLPPGKGRTFDCLGDAEGRADPAWGPTSPTGLGDLEHWRPSVDPSTLPLPAGSVPPPPPPVEPPPPVTPPVQPPPTDYTRMLALIAELQQHIDKIEADMRAVRVTLTAPFSATSGRTFGHTHQVTVTRDESKN